MKTNSQKFTSVVASHGVGKAGLPQKEWTHSGKYPVLGQGSAYIEGYTDRADLVITPPKDGLILYGGHTRRAKFVDFSFVPGPNVKVLRPVDKILNTKFLFYFLVQLPVQSKGYADHFPIVKRSVIPIPDLAEQERIVAILEEAEKLKQKRAEANAKMVHLIPALFVKTFGDPVSNPKQWNKVQLKELVSVVSGATPSKQNINFWNGHFPWVSAKDMKQDFLAGSIDYVTEQALTDTNLKLIPKGSILVVVRGMILARYVPVTVNQVETTINQDLKALVPNEEKIAGLYLWAFLKYTLINYPNIIKTAAHGTKKIETQDLLSMEVMIPPISLQNQFAEAVKEIEVQKEKQRQSAIHINSLFSSLLAKSYG